jgi:fatty acid desaturase
VNGAPPMSDAEKADHIRTVVLQAGEALRQRYPWLRHQDAIGATIMVLSLLGMVASGWLYVQGHLAWWVCVPLTAIFASFIHELEHDLIHLMYFRKRPWLNNLMLFVGWLARASTVNPFVRRRMHLHHHKASGTPSDLEERGITNGERWGLKRLLMTGDNILAMVLRPFKMNHIFNQYMRAQQVKSRREKRWIWFSHTFAFLPLGNFYYLCFHVWVVWHAAQLGLQLGGHSVNWPAWVMPVAHALDVAAVVYMLPSLLRTFCIQFISSNMHYYGDVEPRNAMQQCQVLNPWWLWPVQLFCFNFGSTHAIHHFAVKEPFYIRQWTARVAHQVMREMGVRFNDYGTFRRANRFHERPQVMAATVRA